jgi:hypothetical protein
LHDADSRDRVLYDGELEHEFWDYFVEDGEDGALGQGTSISKGLNDSWFRYSFRDPADGVKVTAVLEVVPQD